MMLISMMKRTWTKRKSRHCYRDVTLLIPSTPRGKRDITVMEDGGYIEVYQRRKIKPSLAYRILTPDKTIILTKVENLIFDPVLTIIVITILDDAFDAKMTSA